jgi:hypothetical protein
MLQKNSSLTTPTGRRAAAHCLNQYHVELAELEIDQAAQIVEFCREKRLLVTLENDLIPNRFKISIFNATVSVIENLEVILGSTPGAFF